MDAGSFAVLPALASVPAAATRHEHIGEWVPATPADHLHVLHCVWLC